jgi:hypothetical protein
MTLATHGSNPSPASRQSITESQCIGESDHDWIIAPAQGPHAGILGHPTSRCCRKCNMAARWLVRVSCCPRCHTHPGRHQAFSAEHGEHTPYKGHRLQRVCDACHEHVDAGLYERRPGCAACFLAAPRIESPARGEELPLGPVAIQWTRVAGATHYLLEVVDASTGDMLAGFPRAVSEASFTLPGDGLMHGHAYFVDVAAMSDMDGPTWSPELLRAFRIEPPLRIEAVDVEKVTDAGAEVTWWTNRPASSRVHIGDRVWEGDDGVQHRVRVTDLAAGSHHRARIESRQAPGSYAATAEAAWDTLPGLDLWAVAVAPGATTAQVTWKSSLPASSQVRVNGRWHGDEWPGPDGGTREHNVRVGGLRPGTLYSMLVRSRRAPGLSQATAAGTFTTLSVLAIADVEICADETRVAVGWKTSLPARSRVHVDGQWHDQARPGPDGETTEHCFEIKGLVPGTRYELILESSQAPGLPVATVTRDFCTRPALVISGLAAESWFEQDGTLSAVLTWTTNHPASSWVRVDGAWFGQDHGTCDHEVRVSGLSPVQPCQADIESRQAPGLSMATQTIEIARIWDVGMDVAATESALAATVRWKTSHEMDGAVDIGGVASSDELATTYHVVRIEGLAPVDHQDPEPPVYPVAIASRLAPAQAASARRDNLPVIWGRRVAVQLAQEPTGASRATVTVQWRTSYPMRCTFRLGLEGSSPVPLAASAAAITHEVRLEQLLAGRYRVRIDAETADRRFTAQEEFTLELRDTRAPVSDHGARHAALPDGDGQQRSA